MTKQDFLDELGVSHEEFRELVQQFSYFFDPLSKAQKHAVHRMMPTIAEAAKTFGPDVTPAQLEKILAGILKGIEFIVLGCYTGRVTSPNPGRSIAPQQTKTKKPKQPKS